MSEIFNMKALKTICIEKQEVQDGFVYTFPGTNEVLEQLFSVILYQRNNLPLFKFELTVQDVNSHIRLRATGPEGAKDTLGIELNL
jgi:hypothetical protein